MCIADAYAPPRLVSRIANHLGYCSLRLEHETNTVDQEFLLDAGASLELLLLEDIAQQLRLVQTGCYIEIVGAGGTVRTVECQGMTSSCLPIIDHSVWPASLSPLS